MSFINYYGGKNVNTGSTISEGGSKMLFSGRALAKIMIPLLIQHMAAVGAEQNPGEQPHFIVAVRAFALFA